jgi:hypothetical protein
MIFFGAAGTVNDFCRYIIVLLLERTESSSPLESEASAGLATELPWDRL